VKGKVMNFTVEQKQTMVDTLAKPDVWLHKFDAQEQGFLKLLDAATDITAIEKYMSALSDIRRMKANSMLFAWAVCVNTPALRAFIVAIQAYDDAPEDEKMGTWKEVKSAVSELITETKGFSEQAIKAAQQKREKEYGRDPGLLTRLWRFIV
jgi:hypothetical protein